MPPLAAFPKCFMNALVVDRTMTVFDWIELAASLDVAGIEMYPAFFTGFDDDDVDRVRAAMRERDLVMPMLCASPDFTIPDPEGRQREIETHQGLIDLVARFDAPMPRTCRVLSGQRRPEVSVDDGVRWVVAAIEELLPYAEERGVVLAIENHYKDNFWQHPEFAQHLPVLKRIVDAIDSPWFGVNYDPSNALLAGEEPLAVLDALKDRVVSMHASDRHLKPGYTLDDLRAQEDSLGYAACLQHGVIGQGLNDYDAIFRTLAGVGFDGWISLEDGDDPETGMVDLQESVRYLQPKIMAAFGWGRSCARGCYDSP